MNSGSRAETLRLMSLLTATRPPIVIRSPVPAVAAGMLWRRSRSSSSSVRASWGEVVETTVSTAVSPAGFATADATEATPLTERSWSPTASARESRRLPDPPWATSRIGAENPGPNPSDSRL